MPGVGVEVLIVVLLVVFNGVLAMSELAIVSARRVRLRQRAEDGSAGARAAIELAENPNRFLSTVQIGITLVGILAGAFGGATLSGVVSDALRDAPLIGDYADALGVALVVLAITYLSLVIGELVPKRLALHNPEGIAVLVARPMGVLATITKPFVWLLSISTELVLRLLRLRPSGEPDVTEDEIRSLLEQGADAGVIEEAEEELVASIFRLGDRRVASLMTPRHRLVWLNTEDSADVNRRKILESGYSAFPVCRGDLDELLGIVTIRALWERGLAPTGPVLRELAAPPLFVPEQARVLDALELLRERGAHRAVVLDEFGVVQGLLAVNDVLDDIAGEAERLEGAAADGAIRRDDGSWLLDGGLAADEARHLLGIETPWPGEEDEEFGTLGGMVMARLGRIPSAGDSFYLEGRRYEVLDMDERRVDKVLVTREDRS